MLTAISRPISVPHEGTGSLLSLVNRFLNWSADQQEYRFGWQGIGLLGFTCVFTPLTVLMIFLTGADPFLIVITLIPMEITLILNLTTMPTKITIPAFFLGIVTDITIVVVSVLTLI